MKKIKLLCILIVSLFTFVTIPTNIYSDELPRVIDQAALLTQEQIDSLTTQIKSIASNYNVDIVIVTTNDKQGKTIDQYTIDYYEENHYGYGINKDGMILAVSMDSREWRIETWGYCTDIMSDHRYDNIEKLVVSALSKGNYYRAFSMYLEDTEFYLSQGVETPVNSTVDSTSEQEYNKPQMIVGALALGPIVAWIILFVQKRKLRSVILQQNASEYLLQDSFILSKQEDRFLYSNTTRTHKPKPKSESRSSSSSSSSHSSGGRGGRGGTF